jgi:hypothetical protein
MQVMLNYIFQRFEIDGFFFFISEMLAREVLDLINCFVKRVWTVFC